MSESSAFGAEGFDQLLARAREALESMRGGVAPDGAEPSQGAGSADDEKIRVTVTAPGRITSLELDPVVMRRPSEDLAADLVAAVNAALDDLRANATEAGTGPDLDALNGQLAELHEGSVRQMAYFTSAANSAIDQIRARRDS